MQSAPAEPQRAPVTVTKRPMGVLFAIVGTLVTLLLFGIVIIGLMLTRAPTTPSPTLTGVPAISTAK